MMLFFRYRKQCIKFKLKLEIFFFKTFTKNLIEYSLIGIVKPKFIRGNEI